MTYVADNDENCYNESQIKICITIYLKKSEDILYLVDPRKANINTIYL